MAHPDISAETKADFNQRVSRYLNITLPCTCAGVLINLLWPPLWWLAAPFYVPLTACGIWIIANHKKSGHNVNAILLGGYLALLGPIGLALFTEVQVDKPFSDLARTVYMLAGLTMVVGTGTSLILKSYLASSKRWRQRGDKGIDELLLLLEQDDADVPPDKAALLLGEFRVVGAVEPLINALHSENPWLRGAAAHALGAVGDERALPALDLVATQDDGYDRNSIRNSEIAAAAIARIKERLSQQ